MDDIQNTKTAVGDFMSKYYGGNKKTNEKKTEILNSIPTVFDDNCNNTYLYKYASPKANVSNLRNSAESSLSQVSEKDTMQNLYLAYNDGDTYMRCESNFLPSQLLEKEEEYKTIIQKSGIDASDIKLIYHPHSSNISCKDCYLCLL